MLAVSRIESAGPVHFHHWLTEQELSCHPVEYIEVAVAVGVTRNQLMENLYRQKTAQGCVELSSAAMATSGVSDAVKPDLTR